MAEERVVYISHLNEVLDKIDETTAKRMTKAVMAVQEEAFRLTAGPGKGRMYFIPGTRTKYRASAPFDPPAPRTGILHKTIKWELQGEGAEIEGLVGSDQKYAPALEYGTATMLPRPWLRPAFEKSEETVKRIFVDRWF